MPNIRTTNDPTKNLLAPSVYIESVEVDKSSIEVFLSLQDDNNSWINDQSVLNSLFVNITVNEQKPVVISLANLRNVAEIKNNSIYFSKKIITSAPNITITAFCANKNIVGPKTVEIVKKNNVIVNATYEGTTLNYLNKFKNLEIFSNPIPKFDKKPNKSIKNPTYDLLFSYNFDKKADFGFVFSLEYFLQCFSSYYRALMPYTRLKKIILENSIIDGNKTFFSKRKKTILKTEYKKINNKILSYRISDENNRFFITTSDSLEDKSDKGLYEVKIDIFVKDYSLQLIEQSINNLKKSIFFIENYKNVLETLAKNKDIQDWRSYFFTNNYTDEFIKEINTVVNDVAYVFSVFFFPEENTPRLLVESNTEQLISLVLSIFHPLTTRKELLGKLSQFLEKIVSSLLALKEQAEPTNGVPNKEISLEKTINYTFEFHKNSNRVFLDYNYDQNFGFEVLANDTFFIRQKELSNTTNQNEVFRGSVTNTTNSDSSARPTVPETQSIGIKVIDSEIKSLRKLYEGRKYLNNPSTITIDGIKDFSISFIDLGDFHYNFLYDSKQIMLENARKAFVKINEYNNHDFSYNSLQSFFYQLADKQIVVKTISAGVNESKNSLRKSVLFDPNIDSSQKSLEFITSTGVEELYYLLDNTPILRPLAGTFHYLASNLVANSENPSYTFTTTSNATETPKNIFFFNSIYSDDVIESGTNFRIKILREKTVSNMFTKKLRHFNRVYLEKIKNPQPTSNTTQIFINTTETAFNVLSKFLSRNVQKGSLLINTEQI